ncbi:protein of unknown function [Actinacidiphila yanglinensis]|uniref:DUF4132 domain-containing protein n=1 Tax=Actinacidiphila yanglinensis TaxID=310779 RepID=A0A1H5VQS3_9ACTN|nr:DUF4132 domain-containing protein [Actinacidiphila yanglinensis]SEF89574.1 protein of unknown function [Actinacidiphila yanglinensis]
MTAPATDEVARRLAELLAAAPGPEQRHDSTIRVGGRTALEAYLDERFGYGTGGWNAVARAVLRRPTTPERTPLLRGLLLAGPYGFDPAELAGLVQAVFDAGALDDDLLHPLLRWGGYRWRLYPADEHRTLAYPEHGPHLWEEVTPECREALAGSLDRLVDLLTAAPDEESVQQLPRWHPRGPRFFLRALDLWRAEAAAPTGDRTRGAAAVYLAAARLSAAEQADLVGVLKPRPVAERRAAVALAATARHDEPLDLLDLLDAAHARPLAALVRDGLPPVDPECGAVDLAVLRAVELPPDRTADLLPLLCATATTVTADLAGLGAASAGAGDDLPELLLARYGLNRKRVHERVRRNAHSAIACLGLLPLTGGETVLDRYLALRERAKAAARFGAERRANHLRAVRAGLWHLAQTTGYASADRLEWDMEARLATGTPQQWTLGAYALALDLSDPAVPLSVERAGKRLASVPEQVRQDAAYAGIRTVQERLREQVRRLRSGLIEPLVADGDLLDADAFDRLLALPAARSLLSALVLRTAGGDLGLLDLTGPVPALAGLDGTRVPLGPAADEGGERTRVGAAHPLDLVARGVLAAWQREIVARRIRQPVKQVFREWYRLTGAERESGTWSARFAGRTVDGPVASRLLAARGWRVSPGEGQTFATRRLGGCHAVLRFDELGHFLAEGPAVTGPTGFVDAVGGPGHRRTLGAAVPLAEVPALALSEAMRDVDLVVSVAAREPAAASPSESAASARAALLAALVADLGLDRVTVDGRFARVRGTRADYRVHLGSGSVHVEPGGHLCIVPAGLTREPHRDLFLPFADDDAPTSVILSKVLLLADDARLTDADILRQIAAVTAPKDAARQQL